MKIKFPINWKHYTFQVPLWKYLMNGGRKAIAVWHRRAGKDILALNWITYAALKEIGTYWYVYPTYEQARLSVWDGMTLDGRPYMSFLPKDAIAEVQQSKQRIVFKNGSIIQFIGSNRRSGMRGAGIKGAVISEYSVHDPRAMQVIEPMIQRSQGWLLFLYTPSDDPRLTHGQDLYLKYKDVASVYCDLKTIDDTFDENGQRLVDIENTTLDMTTEQIRREFYCDFEAFKYKLGSDGGTFTDELRAAEREGRLTDLIYDPAYPVNTYWDVGVVDYTVIWFIQEKPNSIDIIDFFAARGRPMEFFLSHLKYRPYTYGRNVLPFDMQRRGNITLDRRVDEANLIAEKLDLPRFEVGKKYSRDDMISRAKVMLGKCRIDHHKCMDGIVGLYEFDAMKKGTNSCKASDISDAFCYMAMDAKTGDDKVTAGLDLGSMQFRKSVNRYNPFDSLR